MSTAATTNANVSAFDAVDQPLSRLRLAIDQAERELKSLRRAYLEVRLLTSTPSPGVATACELRELSRQESRVVTLLMQGMSNREIAEGLHVSVHTVKTHVQNILRKNGLRSRWQIASNADG